MSKTFSFPSWFSLISLVNCVCLLAACGGGGGGTGGGNTSVSRSVAQSSIASSTSVVSSSTSLSISSSSSVSNFSSSLVSTSSSVINSSASSVSTGTGDNLMGGAVQGTPLDVATVVTTLAGASKSVDGVGLAASFVSPFGITSDGSNLYVADTWNHKIRKIVIATGVVTTLAGSGSIGSEDGTGTLARFNYPTSITTDGTNLYIADRGNHKIRKLVIETGVVTTLAGSGSIGSLDGTGASATFNEVYGITNDGTNLYIADTIKIRRIVIATGVVTTLAGNSLGSEDGTGTAASFNWAFGITTDGTNLYVADSGNNKIRKIEIATGVVTTLAGSGSEGSADGTGTAATFNEPRGITIDGVNLYIADSFNNKIRKLNIDTGVVTTLAGGLRGRADGIGSEASFSTPASLIIDGNSLYVADAGNSLIRKIISDTSTVTTLAGGGSEGVADGTGTAARFNSPEGITTDGTNLYLSDTENHKIRKIVIETGVVTTLAGSGSIGSADGTGTAASFYYPRGITTDGTNLYVGDTWNNKIRKIVIATGVVTTLAGSGSIGSVDGASTVASFSDPRGITTDGTNLYVTDHFNNKIRKIVISTGEVTTLAGSGLLGDSDGAGTEASFFGPSGITTDGSNLYIAEYTNHKIRKIVISTGVVTTLAGGNFDGVDGIGTAASFYKPGGITSDGTNLYVTDTGNHKIRKIVIATGEVTTLTGGAAIGSTDGVGAAASFDSPSGITTNGFALFVSDSGNNIIRRID